ncbi:CBO0543 family protein [Brevibacillus fulvus]|uniref:Uncharacterized protein n=1 Tax=Brevibacillus fulvus TaxID=1125967 RepID=A0A938XY65_9BACL|nr:CBO0543 family protein [Brevibacillus fulvus]MBM7589079.1 hypothetical protein [Brevibacillus fulvus]
MVIRLIVLVASILLFNACAFLVPKRLSHIEIYATMLFSCFFQLLLDFIFSAKYHLYGYFNENAEWRDLLVILGIYPAISILYVNYIPSGKRWGAKVCYILGWSIFSLIYEWVSLKAGYFYYHGWKFWYSALLYPILLTIVVGNLTFVRNMAKKQKSA